MPCAPLSMSPSQLKKSHLVSAVRMDGLHLHLPCEFFLLACIKLRMPPVPLFLCIRIYSLRSWVITEDELFWWKLEVIALHVAVRRWVSLKRHWSVLPESTKGMCTEAPIVEERYFYLKCNWAVLDSSLQGGVCYHYSYIFCSRRYTSLVT